MTLDVEAFAADRGERLENSDAELAPIVTDALAAYPAQDWAEPIVTAASVLWLETYEAAGGDPGDASQPLQDWQQEMTQALARTTTPQDPPAADQVDRITFWVSTSAANGGTVAAADTTRTDLQWVTRRDDAVRDTHVAADGQRRAAGRAFDIGGYPLYFPGQPVGPPDIWLGCRCLLYPVDGAGPTMNARKGETMTLQAEPEIEEIDDQVDPDAPQVDLDGPMPWHGVLAPEGVPTGDGRQFAVDSLTHRDLPLPLRYAPVDNGGHDGAVIVGNIQRIWREDNNLMGEGEFHDGPHANEAVDLIAQGMLRGVSVDLDEVDVEFADADGSELEMITSGRISAATLVAIPAFDSAFVTLGSAAEAEAEFATTADCLPCQQFAVSEEPWDGSASRFTDEEWFASTCLHRNGDSRVKSDNGLPIREPGGALNRAAVHAAAARFNQTEADPDAKAAAAACLRSAYAELEEDVPEVLQAAAQTQTFAVEVGDRVTWVEFVAADEVTRTGTVTAIDGETATVAADHTEDPVQVPLADLTEVDREDEGEPVSDAGSKMSGRAEFAPGTRDGPGWVTNPEDSQRLRNYWARGEGAAKIRWGQPGDFNRCRRQLARYIANPQWLAGTCANLHKVALGVWPGQEAALAASAAPMFSLVASSTATAEVPADISSLFAPRSWFEDPNLSGPTPLRFEQEGGLVRIRGHLAEWGTCHTGIDGVCRTAPSSQTDYAYFANGSYLTAEGETIPVGRITLDTGHAEGRLGATPAVAHYDNTGTVAAYVAAGEDEHGIWVSGVVAPWLDSGALTRLRGAVLSGDWRMLRGNLELVAALAVNVPGFPIPRTALTASGGVQTSLVAAGILPLAPEPERPQSLGDLADALYERLRAREAAHKKVEAALSVFASIRTEKINAARALLKED